MKNKKSRTLLIALFWIALWQVGAMLISKPLLFPSPAQTVEALIELLKTPEFYLDVLATLGRCVAAILLALALGFLLSFVSYKLRIAREFLEPLVSFCKSIPVMALAIYFIFMFSSSNVPILVCLVTCFPIVYTNLLTGFDNIDKGLLEMASIYNIKGFALVRFINMPSLHPYFLSATKLVTGISWKAIVTAEVLSVPQLSIGYELMNAKYYLETSKLFAYVATIIFMSVLFEKLVLRIVEGNRLKPYAYSAVGRISKPAKYVNYPAEEIEVIDVSKSYGENKVLNNVSVKLASGTKTAVMAPSGTGKTTLFRVITGLEKRDSGTVKISDRVSYVFQEDRLIPWLNIYDNLAIVLNDRNKIEELLAAVNLTDDMYKLPEELSGGMNHRAALARAFLYGAGTMLLDEPFRGLDRDTRDEVIEKLWQPNAKDKTILMATHDEELAERLADGIISK